jgi:AraC-like DNA-binding protein
LAELQEGVVNSLKIAVRAYASCNANRDGVALAPVPGLVMKYLEAPGQDLHAISRPMIILVLQGAKRLIAGKEEQIFSAGQSLVISADMPIVSRVLQASLSEPYMAIGVELEMALLRELAVHLGGVAVQHSSRTRRLFEVNTEAAAVDCAMRLMRLIDTPEAVPLLRPGIMQELHYWLLSGKHGSHLRALADPTSHASRLGAAVAILRADYRSHISVEHLATAAGMSLSAFHKYFKLMTSVTPVQYQKRLRLIEARRLMIEQGLSASAAAFDVGYESVSQFTREYGRLFQAPPKRDTLRLRETSWKNRCAALGSKGR